MTETTAERGRSTPGAAGRTGTRDRVAWLVLPGLLGLTAFYYLARPDAIGVSSAARPWIPMTGAAVAPWLHFLAAAGLLGVGPVAAAALAGRPPRSLGLGAGRWREGLVWLAVGLPLAVLAGRVAAGDPAMQAVYPLYPAGLREAHAFRGYAALQLVYYAAWEILFRGVLLFGLEDAIGGRNANVVQTALSVTAHFGRALPETLSALPAGLAFGGVALRTRSVWPLILVHWTVGVGLDWFILHGAGI